jgi:hypothetical protein
VLAAGAAPAAAADTWYASPGGGGSGCTSGGPCSIQTALDGAGSKAANGDTVVLLPGGAGEFFSVDAATPIHVRHAVNVVGDSAGPRPLVKVGSSSDPTFTFETDAANSTIRHVAFEMTGAYGIRAPGRLSISDVHVKAHGGCFEFQAANSSVIDSTFESETAGLPCLGGYSNGTEVRNVDVTATGPIGAVSLYGEGGLVDGIRVRSAGEAGLRIGGTATNPFVVRRADVRGTGLGIWADGGAVVTDSLVTMSGDNSQAIVATGGGRLRNLTAIATGSGSRGLYIFASGDTSATTDVRNSILRGDGKDVVIEKTEPGQGDPGCVDPMFCLPYVPRRSAGTLVIGNSDFRTTEVGSGGTLTDAGGNISANPLFANTEAADYHLSPGSPAIDAGADFPENGAQDLDGAVRKQGAAVDMGAYELPIPHVEPDTTRPLVTGLGETNRVFAVGRAATPVSARARRHRKGTTFVFRSSEAGTATLKISRARPGRRRGKRCVKPTRKSRRAKRCTRYVPVKPWLRRAVAGGATAVPFSGRIGKKALRPGRYRLTVVVADAAGNRSKPKSIGFRVVRR